MKYIKDNRLRHYPSHVNGVKNVFIGQEYCIFQRIYGKHISGDSRIVRREKSEAPPAERKASGRPLKWV
jgi:hypothetical protein